MAFRRTRDDTGCFVKQSSMARPGGAETGTIELALVFVPRRGEALGERSGKRGDCQSIPESFALSLRLLDLHRCFSHSLSCAGFSLHTSLEASAANTGAVSHAAARRSTPRPTGRRPLSAPSRSRRTSPRHALAPRGVLLSCTLSLHRRGHRISCLCNACVPQSPPPH